MYLLSMFQKQNKKNEGKEKENSLTPTQLYFLGEHNLKEHQRGITERITAAFHFVL